jgi:tRNA-splicing ligase RtcB
MYTIMPGTVAPVWSWQPEGETLDYKVQEQLRTAAALPWVHSLKSMSDAHLGYGVAIGTVLAMRGAVSPAAVGVDIGCGMAATLTSLTAADLPDDLSGIRAAIEKAVPVGFNSHDGALRYDRLDTGLGGWDTFWSKFKDLHPGVQNRESRAYAQCGTLGSGNHFIEVCLDEQDRVWIMLHSGSRNVGKELAERHITVAQSMPQNQDLRGDAKELAVFLTGTPEMNAYLHDLYWAQEYALRNRAVMLALVKSAVRGALGRDDMTFGEPVQCHHNYVAEEHWDGQDLIVTRKGAIKADLNQAGIIPGSIGASSFIVRGLGNPDSFASASHGAGRRMSRAEAKRRFTVVDVVEQTAGVECRKDAGVIDEIPAAYKSIDAVMAAQSDLVEVTARLKQIVSVKG